MTLILTIDNGSVTGLTLLDLSATFDTTNHDILIRRLSTRYGIFCRALTWYSSHLIDRRQAIKIGNCFSDMLPTSSGVLQRSVLGPLFFTMYITPLNSAIQRHNLDHHLYAIDTQIYIYFVNHTKYFSIPKPVQELSPRCLALDKNSKLKLITPQFSSFVAQRSVQKLDSVFPTHILSLIEYHTISLSLTSRSNV